MKRIVFTIAVGKPKFAHCALGLGRSLRLLGDSAHRVVYTDLPDYPWRPAFDEVVPFQGDLNWIFFHKLDALEVTDADQVLFVDGDTLAFQRLDPIFEACAGKGFAVQGEWIRDGEWYGDVREHLRRHAVAALPQFNGGMLYYERTPEGQAFLETIRDYGRRARELGFQRDDPLVPDEPCIALAMAQTGQGHLLPDASDFQNSAVGLVGRLNMDVARGECDFVCRRYTMRHVRPILFHASRYINFRIYWRQLATLERLEGLERSREYGHMTFAQRLQRSFEKRLLKHVYRKL